MPSLKNVSFLKYVFSVYLSYNYSLYTYCIKKMKLSQENNKRTNLTIHPLIDPYYDPNANANTH